MVDRKPQRIVVDGTLQDAPGGAGGPGSDWSLIVHLAPWQRAMDSNAAIELDPLRLEVEVSEKQLKQIMGRLSEGSTIRVTLAQLTRTPNDPHGRWLGIGQLPVRSVSGSTALRTARAELDRPVEMDDVVLGRLVIDRRFNWYQGTRRIGGRDCSINLMRSTPSHDRTHDRRDIARAARAIVRLEARFPMLLDAIARDKLKLYNDTWRERGPRLTQEEFLAKIRPTSVVVCDDGAATVYFSAGRLFAEHSIEVRIGSRGGITETCLAG